ncbi:MAG TPA: tryptophan synthase subunit alpha [Phycisphaerales bacterium]|nr:tryptophan synthase subunit alpha [Phycisphaerales bacterium]
MNRIDAIFARARSSGSPLLMPFICGGHPSLGDGPGLLRALEEGGAGIVEIGFPFSDPIADGPVIAAAMHAALERGVTPDAIFRQVESVRAGLGVGLVAMVSASIVFRAGGPAGFARRAAAAGFDGVIYPDAPLEEAAELLSAARAEGLTASLLIAPTTSPERAEAIAGACSGFVYLLARTGITGERGEAPDVGRRVARLREATPLPIACGFGISTPEHVRAVVAHADAAIVGSALIRRIDQAGPGGSASAAAGSFMAELSRALPRAPIPGAAAGSA